MFCNRSLYVLLLLNSVRLMGLVFLSYFCCCAMQSVFITLQCCYNRVVVIACFVTFIFGIEIFTNDTVPASCMLTGVGAGIKVCSIAIVAGFATIYAVITASSKGAVGVAAVTINFVAVIACFVAFCSKLDILAANSIAAACVLAAVCAGIEGVLIAIIAGLPRIETPVAADFA